MPPVVAAVNFALAAAVTAIVPIAAVGNFVLAYGVQTLLLAGAVSYSSSQQRKAKRALASSLNSLDQGRNIMVRDPVAPRQIVYGQVVKSGSISFMHVAGTDNEFIYLNVDLVDHLCEELGTVYFDGVEVPLDGSGEATGTFAGYARVKKFLGLAAGERDMGLEAELPGVWTSSDVGKNIARLHVRLKHNPNLFPSGIPVITCKIKGKKVYDPRTGLTEWSNNSALCTADYLMDTRFGKGIALARVRTDDLSEAANICDETVVLADASAEARYTCNGVINTDEDPDDVLASLAESMAGHVSDPGGKWTIRAGAWRAPEITLTDSHLVGAVSVMPRLSRQETFNGVRGTFFSELNNWAPADFPAVKNDTYMAWDGGVRLWKDVAYRFTTSHATAQRLAKIELERGRQQITFSGPYMLKAMQCQPGDVIAINRDRLGWSGKYFEVTEWSFVIERGVNGMPVLAVKLVCRETAPGVWDWNDGEETTVDLAPNTTLLDARSVPTPAAPTLSTSNFVQADGSITPRLKVQWSEPSSSQVTNGGFVEIEYKKSADADWLVWATSLRGDLTLDYITDVLAGVSYDVRIRFRNVFGVRGSYSATATATVSTDTTAPASPSGFAVVGIVAGIRVTWSANGEDDLAGYVLYRSGAADFGTATEIWRGTSTQYVDRAVSYGSVYYYWLKAIDRTDNLSAAAASSGVGPLQVATGDIENGAGTTVKLANGAVSQMTSVLAASSNSITNNAWTEVAACTVNAQAGQDVVLSVMFSYSDAGGTPTTDFDVRFMRDGVEIDSQDQTVRQGVTDMVTWGSVDPDLASGVTEYSVEVRPRGGGGTGTPDIRDPLLTVILLKDRLN